MTTSSAGTEADEVRVLDTPVGWAQQILEDAEVAKKNSVRLSEPQQRNVTLATAYLDALEELRKLRNGVKALTHDLGIYKAIAEEKLHGDRQAGPADQPAAQEPG